MTRTLSSTLLLASMAGSALITAAGANYTITKDYTSTNFFNEFSFFTDADPTNGFVKFKSMDQANSSALAGVVNAGNASNAIFLGVDTISEAPQGRGALRVISNDSFQHGLFIADIVHMPTGCGTWPAFWMLGPSWPQCGEIDIVEGVNLQAANSMALHTGDTSLISAQGMHGTIMTQDCNVYNTSQVKNGGCQIVDQSNVTFGAGFNAAGGGVYATEWRPDFIKIWFFPRGHIPNDIGSGQPQPSDKWGKPRSHFQGNFSMDSYFHDLQLVFDTTFCGDWAGKVWNSSECASLAPTCEVYVQSNPTKFKEAFWSVNRLQVWQDQSLNNSLTFSYNQAASQKRDEGHHRHGTLNNTLTFSHNYTTPQKGGERPHRHSSPSNTLTSSHNKTTEERHYKHWFA